MTLDELVAQMVDQHEFVRLVNAVHVDMYPSDFQVIDGTRGDNGNDGYIASKCRMLAIYCPVKPEQRRDADYKAKIESDLQKAIALRDQGGYAVEAWTFITPRKLPDHVISWMHQLGNRSGVRVHHQESTFLAGELQRRRHLLAGFSALKLFDIDEALKQIKDHLKPSSPPQKVGSTADLAPTSTAASNYTTQSDTQGRALFDQLSDGYPSPAAKAQLKALSYKTTDPILEIETIRLLMRWWSPADDDLSDTRNFAERGIARAQELNMAGVSAAFHAQLAAFTAFEFNQLLLEHHYGMKMSAMIGLPPTSAEIDRRQRLTDLTNSLAAQASQCTENLSRGVTAVEASASLQILGAAYGQIAQCLRGISAASEADRYIGHAKKLLLAAKDASAAAGDELGAVNATFNLANQIRFHGGGMEAIELAKVAMDVAVKHGDQLLHQKAAWLVEAIETGTVPAYELGERRK